MRSACAGVFEYTGSINNSFSDKKSPIRCTDSLLSKYFITEYTFGEHGYKPHNFVTIGGTKAPLKSYSFVGENSPAKQFNWLSWANITMSHWNVSLEYVTSKTTKPSDHQLVVNTSTSKLKLTFLNDTLPAPPGKY